MGLKMVFNRLDLAEGIKKMGMRTKTGEGAEQKISINKGFWYNSQNISF